MPSTPVPARTAPFRFVLAAGLLLLAACAPRRIPDTEIPDTRDTRAILDVLKQYREATEKRDAQALLALVSPSFQDDAGTATPADDLDYAKLQQVLPERMAALQDVSLELSVRRIDVEGNQARAVFYYTSSYRMPGVTQKAQTDSDLMEMELRREDGAWKIVSGL